MRYGLTNLRAHPLLVSSVLAVSVVVFVEWQAADVLRTAGFWFDAGTFGTPMLGGEWGGPLTEDDLTHIEAVAWDELSTAFDGLDLVLSESRDGFFQVAVVPAPPNGDRVRMRLAGQSRPLGPLGGRGVVYFQTLAGLAVTYAPAGAERHQVIEGIGRGVARSAAHEFAHQLLPNADLHGTDDEYSYEFGSAQRSSQYYGALQWAFAGPMMADRLRGQGLSFRR
jgi:hypothetical protein